MRSRLIGVSTGCATIIGSLHLGSWQAVRYLVEGKMLMLASINIAPYFNFVDSPIHNSMIPIVYLHARPDCGRAIFTLRHDLPLQIVWGQWWVICIGEETLPQYWFGHCVAVWICEIIERRWDESPLKTNRPERYPQKNVAPFRSPRCSVSFETPTETESVSTLWPGPHLIEESSEVNCSKALSLSFLVISINV